jgi:hypothetical protein
MNRPRTAAIAAIAAGLATMLAVAATASGASRGTGSRPAAPRPAAFEAPVTNPYFPLVPGSVSILRGTSDGEHIVDRVVVTDRTKVITGVTTTVVHDVIRSHGVLVEKTDDWYASDDQGNVWYFGEATAEYDGSGTVISTEGSWEAGVDGAVAGIIMPADPRPTDAYRQEFYPDHAEDQAWIVQRGLVLDLPTGPAHHVVRSFEWTRLEPRVVAEKFYAPGIGIVREHDVAGADEDLFLVRFVAGA